MRITGVIIGDNQGGDILASVTKRTSWSRIVLDSCLDLDMAGVFTVSGLDWDLGRVSRGAGWEVISDGDLGQVRGPSRWCGGWIASFGDSAIGLDIVTRG